jgi:hypothetical protein
MLNSNLKNFGFIALIAMFFTTNLFAQTLTWTDLNGPWRAGNAKDISVGYVSGTRTLFVADSGYKLIKSTNDGVSWSATGTQVNNPVNVVCKPSNANWVLVATYLGNPLTGTVQRSTDGGSSFVTPLPLSEAGMDPRRFGMSSVDQAKVFLGTKYVESRSSLRKSTNGGATWANDNFFLNLDDGQQHAQTHVLGIAWHPSDANKVLVAGSANDLPYTFTPDQTTEDTYIDSTQQTPAPVPLKKGYFIRQMPEQIGIALRKTVRQPPGEI